MSGASDRGPNAGMIAVPSNQIAPIMADVRRFGGTPLHLLDVTQARAALDERRRSRPAFSDDRIAIRDEAATIGSASLMVRHYRPRHGDSGGCILYCHGGGWVMGEPSDFDAVCARLAIGSRSAVVSPDYRLAPEWPYPAALDDILSVMMQVATNGPFALVGESAGANLALAATLAARDRRDALPLCLALFYPVLDKASVAMEPGIERDTPFLSAADMAWCWRHYLARAGEPQDYAMPGRAANLDGLPPTLVMHGSIDPTAPMTHAFVRRAQAAGQEVEERCYQGLPHAFTGLLRHEAIGRIVDDASSWLASHLAAAADAERRFNLDDCRAAGTAYPRRNER